MRNITKVAVFANSQSEKVLNEAKLMCDYLKSINIEASVVRLFEEGSVSSFNEDIQVAISLGGDGTVLKTANLIKSCSIPILPVNMGTFGYITETTVEDFKEVFQSFLTGTATVDERIRLSVIVMSRDGKIAVNESALNDIAICASSHSKVAKITLAINGVLASNLKSDGVVISTPTGSTAYNLSANGPILDANLSSCIVINPLCPFTMGFRPLVVDASNEISVSVPKQSSEIILTVDGNDLCKLSPDDKVIITKDSIKTYFVKNDKRNSIEILRDKLGWAGGFNA